MVKTLACVRNVGKSIPKTNVLLQFKGTQKALHAYSICLDKRRIKASIPLFGLTMLPDGSK